MIDKKIDLKRITKLLYFTTASCSTFGVLGLVCLAINARNAMYASYSFAFLFGTLMSIFAIKSRRLERQLRSAEKGSRVKK